MTPNRKDKECLRALLTRWLNSSAMSSQWINYGPLQIYLRKSPVVWQGVLHHKAITIANVSVSHRDQRKGWFTICVEWAMEQDVSLLRVENAITPKMVYYLENRGWTPNGDNPPSYYLEMNS